MAVMPAIDRRSVGAGAALAIAIIVPAVVLFEVIDAVHGIDCDSNLNLVFFAPLVVAWVLGGHLAARRRPEAPFTHGALAALSAFAAFAVVRIATHALGRHASCTDDLPATLVFGAMVAASTGILGGLVASRRP